jgi:hypothetical protein
LLHDILGIFSRACHAPRNEENPLLVTFDQNFKRLEISTLRSSDEGQVTFVGKTVDRSNRCLFLSMLSMNLDDTVSAPS